MKFATLHKISALIAARRYTAAARRIDDALSTEPGVSWQLHLGRLAAFLRDRKHTPFARVLAQGNGKLPFLAFSVLPGVSCPGAGDCLNWCYSFKAWRYPAAYARQAQNMVLVQSARRHLVSALDAAAPPGKTIDFRLYVDGDFDSRETAQFWFDTLAERPHVITYGYSKSLSILRTLIAPGNYKLNLSSGHNADAATVAAVKALPYYRGEFVAVDIGKVSSSDHGGRENNARLRQAYGKPAFTCPGKCGECTPAGHACGSDRFQNIDIIIAAH